MRSILSRRAVALALPFAAAWHPGAAGASTAMRVLRNPGCGCCEAWAEQLRREGFIVTLEESPDLLASRRAAGVPDDLAGCHTGLLAGGTLVVEGHVPAFALRRFLAAPGSWRGIAVAGMPAGSPGMEMPGVEGELYTIFAFAADGRREPFARARGSHPA